MNKPVFLEVSILKFSKIWMYEFWYDYVKPDYVEKANFCHMDTSGIMDTNSFIDTKSLYR